jgi:hypothetical protein
VGGPIAIAVGVGVLSGLFFGTWAAFVSKTHLFEELDRKLDARSGSVDANAPFRSGRPGDFVAEDTEQSTGTWRESRHSRL